MSERTLKFDNIKINKKEFHKSKKLIDLFSVDLDKIVLSGKFKHNDEGFKYFIGYQKDMLVNTFPATANFLHAFHAATNTI